MATIRHLALVPDTKRVDAADVARVAAALQKQVLEDFVPAWHRPSTVDAFHKLEDVPPDYWPMIVRDDIPYDAQGIHLDDKWGPYSLIRWDAGWSLTASHECLEMIADPYGRRVRGGPSPKAGQGNVSFLVEVCDPCEADDFAYQKNGIVVSDFYRGDFFAPKTAAGLRYSFTGSVKKPRQVLRGGYLSWRVSSGEWWQQTWFKTSPTFVLLGRKTAGMTAREFTDGQTRIPKPVLKARRRPTRKVGVAGALMAASAAPPSAPGGSGGRVAALRANVRRIAGVS